MNTYTYTDNRKGEVVFQITAASITDADKAYQDKFGVDIRSQAWVGCRIEKESK